MRHVSPEYRTDMPESVADFTETTRRQHETARLVAARRYWQRTKVRTPFVPPTEDSPQ